VPRRQLANALDGRVLSRNVVQRQVQVQPDRIDSPLDLIVSEQRLQLGAEVQIVAAPVHIQRLDAHAVAAKDQATLAVAPHSKRKHPAEPAERVFAPAKICFEHHLGIAA
jgi:hypothetical protein